MVTVGEVGEYFFDPGFLGKGLKREGGVIGDDGGESVPEWVAVYQVMEDPRGPEFGTIGYWRVGLSYYCIFKATMDFYDLAIVVCCHCSWLEYEGGWLDWLKWCVYYLF